MMKSGQRNPWLPSDLPVNQITHLKEAVVNDGPFENLWIMLSIFVLSYQKFDVELWMSLLNENELNCTFCPCSDLKFRLWPYIESRMKGMETWLTTFKHRAPGLSRRINMTPLHGEICFASTEMLGFSICVHFLTLTNKSFHWGIPFVMDIS